MFVNPCNYTLEDDDDDSAKNHGGAEISAFDPDVIEEENAPDKGEFANRDELQKKIKDGSHPLDQAVIKAELALGFRDKKQLEREKK